MTLEIGSAVLQLPVTALLTLGRHPTPRDDNAPHVDVTPYGAWENGISRNHAEIRRRNKLLYIADLGSTNGSALNGRRLYPGAEKLLRSGDKLQLSRLTLTVKF
jgi:pSer/pThr/pTyr-binding forkhead associated (FHA) protein